MDSMERLEARMLLDAAHPSPRPSSARQTPAALAVAKAPNAIVIAANDGRVALVDLSPAKNVAISMFLPYGKPDNSFDYDGLVVLNSKLRNRGTANGIG